MSEELRAAWALFRRDFLPSEWRVTVQAVQLTAVNAVYDIRMYMEAPALARTPQAAPQVDEWPVPPPSDECKTDKFSSRVCEHGTKTCTAVHAPSDEFERGRQQGMQQEEKLTPLWEMRMSHLVYLTTKYVTADESQQMLSIVAINDLIARAMLPALTGAATPPQEAAPASQEAAAEADKLFKFIAHGDAAHREWLKAACVDFYAGKSRPPPTAQAAPQAPAEGGVACSTDGRRCSTYVECAARGCARATQAAAEPVMLQSVELTRDVYGMCIVKVNGREAIRDNGDVISHYATLDWFAAAAKGGDDAYNELLYAVCNKYPGETRHQTALRYIQQAERSDDRASASVLTEGGKL